MSIKHLFGKTSKSLEDTVQDVESVKFVEQKTKKQDRYIPPVDFSDPKNFAFYGSAQLYYEAAIKRIYEDYPYDGSKAEQIEFEEKASHLERWMFESKYPRTTGYVELGKTGNFTGARGIFQTTDKPEYIRVWGGLHTQDTTKLEDKFNKSAKYDESKNRNQNWNCDFDNGITIEFWMKKNIRTSTTREVILDLWNGAIGSDNFRLVLDFMDLDDSNYLQFTVNTEGALNNRLLDLGSIDVGEWNHYAVSVVNDTTTSSRVIFYLNGDEIESFNNWTNLSSSGKIDGWIGALQTELASNVGETYAGKLQAQLDEFRFWKTCRTSRQIKLNWFSSVGGGANTDDATSDLGVYFKFNEGIVGNSITDSVILDYSGRLANGQWIGYPGSSSRFTGSAIEDRGYKEIKTPIIYPEHPEVKSLISEMSTSGSVYDVEHGQSLFGSMPTWLQEQDNGNFKILSHILASYLDTLHVQIKEMTEIKNKQYRPEEFKANTLASELLKDRGFITPNLFESNEIHEKLNSLNLDNVQFEKDLSEIKNIIYTNIYNNLEKIYKSKGTESSVRNLIRCFGIDDELIRLNLYTDGGIQYFTDKSRETSVKKKYINFNNPESFSASIYQTSSVDNTNTFIYGSHTLVDGSRNAFTLEADIIVPYKKDVSDSGFFGTPFISSSVFGFHQANELDETDYTWHNSDFGLATGSMSLVVDEWRYSKLSSKIGKTFTLTSTDGTTKVYEFTLIFETGTQLANGNIAVKIIGSFSEDLLNIVSAINHVNGHAGKIFASKTSTSISLLQLQAGSAGVTNILTDIPSAFNINQFYLETHFDLQTYLVKDSQGSRNAKFVLKNESGTIYQESDWIYDIYENEHYNVAIRIKPQTYPYASDNINEKPDYDIELYAVTNNLGEINQEVLLSQKVSFDIGRQYIRAPKRVYAGAHIVNFTGSVQHMSDIQVGSVRAWLDYLSNEDIFEHNKDVLNYGQRKSIDGSNLFMIDDIRVPTQDLTILNWDFDTVSISDSSGNFNVDDITSGYFETKYGIIDNIIGKEHKAKGSNFPPSTNSFISNEFLFAKKKQLPETAYDSDNIFIKGEKEINFSVDDDVSDNLFILEKSPSFLVSEEILKTFSTTLEFANLFARPIERFRFEYKDLAHARDLFFQRVESDLDFDRFFEYFKWIDSSISSMVNQLIPLSANFAGGVIDVIEPHILERDKYQRQVGLLNTVTSTEASIRGRQELGYNWRIGHAPIPNIDDPNQYAFWQKERRERDEVEREQIRQVSIRQTDQEYVNPIKLSSSIGVVSGSVYATRRLSRTYELGVDFRNSIHGGINYNKGKDRDFMTNVIRPVGLVGNSGAPVNIFTVGAGDGHGLIPTGSYLDEQPGKLIKRDGYAQVGVFSDFNNDAPLSSEYEYSYRRKLSDALIANIVSSSVNTGYSSVINAGVDENGYKEGVDIVNLHSDTTDFTNEIPIQGPFTNQWVGGRQERHVNIATNAIPYEERTKRPEAWRLLVGTNPIENPGDVDGAFGFTGPDYGQYPNYDQEKAIYYREERAKRPVNIKNIQTIIGTGSHGNYIRGYEVFSTFGDQGYYLRRADRLLPDQIAEALPETTNYQTLIAQTTSDGGNYFGEGNNRQWSLFIPEQLPILGETSSIARFTIKGISTYTQGDNITFKNDSQIQIAKYCIETCVTDGTPITGTTSTEFFDDLKTKLKEDLQNRNIVYQKFTQTSSFPSLRINFPVGKINGVGLETNSSFAPNRYPAWTNGGPWTFSCFIQFNSLASGDISCIYADNGGTDPISSRYTSRKIVFNRNTTFAGGRISLILEYVDGSSTKRTDEFYVDNIISGNKLVNGQRHHLIVSHNGLYGYDTNLQNSTDATICIDGVKLIWTAKPTISYPSPRTILPIYSTVLGADFINNSAITSIALGNNNWTEIDECTIYNFTIVDDEQVSEIYNNGNIWEQTNPTLNFNSFNYAQDVLARWTFADAASSFTNGAMLTDVTNKNNDITVFEAGESTYQKITQGVGASVIEEYAQFSIAATQTGSYGNLTITREGESFYNLLNSTGGVDEVEAVEQLSLGNIIDTQDRSIGSSHVIRTRFSAPGGPEINSSGYLDVATQQYSVHNSINFRNLTLRGPSSGEEDRIRLDTHQVTVSEGRREGLKTLRARHQGKFGIESKYGEISDTGYDTNASYHKQHRNTRYVIKDLVVDGDVVDDKSPKYDNDNYHSLLPASEFQYSWINQAVVSGSNQDWRDDQPILGFSPKNGMTIGSDGYVPAINFPGISDFDQSLCLIAQELRIPIVNLTAGEDLLSLSYTNNIITVLPTIEDFVGTGTEMIPSNWSTLDLDYVFASCCTEEPEFRLNNGAWTTTVPTSEIPNGPIYYSPGSDIYLTYMIKDCLGNQGITGIRFQDASYAEPYLGARLLYRVGNDQGSTSALYTYDDKTLIVAKDLESRQVGEILPPHLSPDDDDAYFKFETNTNISENQQFYHRYYGQYSDGQETFYLEPSEDFPYYHSPGLSLEVRYNTQAGLLEDNITITLQDAAYSEPSIDLNFKIVSGITSKGGYIYETIPNPSFSANSYSFCIDQPGTPLNPAQCEPYASLGNFTINDFNNRTTLFVVSENLNIGEAGSYTQFKYRLSDIANGESEPNWQSRWFIHDDPTQVPFINYNETPIEQPGNEVFKRKIEIAYFDYDSQEDFGKFNIYAQIPIYNVDMQRSEPTENASVSLHWSWGANSENNEYLYPTNRIDIVMGQYKYIEGYQNYSLTNLEDKDLYDMFIRANFGWGTVPTDFREAITTLEFRRVNVASDLTETVVTDWTEIDLYDEPKVFAPNEVFSYTDVTSKLFTRRIEVRFNGYSEEWHKHSFYTWATVVVEDLEVTQPYTMSPF